MTKNQTAVALGKMRWEGKTKKDISNHVAMMNERRLKGRNKINKKR